MLDPLQELGGEILLAGLVLLDQLLVPGEIAIDPGLDRVLVPSSSRHREPAGPAVVGQQGHGDLVPPGRAGGTMAEDGHDHIMPVAKDVGSHHQLLPHRPLDGESPAVNLRRDSGNDHSRRSPVTHPVPVPLRLSCRCHDSLSVLLTLAFYASGRFLLHSGQFRSGLASRARAGRSIAMFAWQDRRIFRSDNPGCRR